MLPITNADEADGICLFVLSILSISKLPTFSCDLYSFSRVPDRFKIEGTNVCLLHQLT